MAYLFKLEARASTLADRAALYQAVALALTSSPSPDDQIIALAQVMDDHVVPRQLSYDGCSHLEAVDVEGLVILFEAARAVVETHVLPVSQLKYYRKGIQTKEGTEEHCSFANLIVCRAESYVERPDSRERLIRHNFPKFIRELELDAKKGLLSKLKGKPLKRYSSWVEHVCSQSEQVPRFQAGDSLENTKTDVPPNSRLS